MSVIQTFLAWLAMELFAFCIHIHLMKCVTLTLLLLNQKAWCTCEVAYYSEDIAIYIIYKIMNCFTKNARAYEVNQCPIDTCFGLKIVLTQIL